MDILIDIGEIYDHTLTPKDLNTILNLFKDTKYFVDFSSGNIVFKVRLLKSKPSPIWHEYEIYDKYGIAYKGKLRVRKGHKEIAEILSEAFEVRVK